jgi:ATP-binding cassette subfamily G (WHITE) protein 2
MLSEGHQLYFGPPQEAANWFDKGLGNSFRPDQHGAVSDWLMDLVSVGFSKPQALSGVSMTSAADVANASELWHAHNRKVKHLCAWLRRS